jgi:hypothetical protein
MKDIADMKKIADFQEFVAEFDKQKSIEVNPKIVKYLKASTVVAATGARVVDEITNENTNIELLAYSDGEYLWDSRDVYYYENYGMPLNNDFISTIG